MNQGIQGVQIRVTTAHERGGQFPQHWLPGFFGQLGPNHFQEACRFRGGGSRREILSPLSDRFQEDVGLPGVCREMGEIAVSGRGIGEDQIPSNHRLKTEERIFSEPHLEKGVGGLIAVVIDVRFYADAPDAGDVLHSVFMEGQLNIGLSELDLFVTAGGVTVEDTGRGLGFKLPLLPRGLHLIDDLGIGKAEEAVLCQRCVPVDLPEVVERCSDR